MLAQFAALFFFLQAAHPQAAFSAERQAPAEALAVMADLEAKSNQLELLTRSYPKMPDPRAAEHQRNQLRTEIQALCGRLSNLRGEHRRAREKNALLGMRQLATEANSKAKPDAPASNFLFSFLQEYNFEESMSPIDQKSQAALAKDKEAYEAVLRAFRIRRLMRISLFILFFLLCAAGVAAYLLRLPDLKPGFILKDNYRVEHELARGETWTVYAATDIGLGRKVALKCVRDKFFSGLQQREAFLNAARAAALLKHPNIAEIYAAFAEAGRVFLVSELVEGHPLDSFLKAGRPFPPATMKAVARQAASALDYARAQKIPHGGLKPSDLMLSREGTVKVLDFAIVRGASRAAPAPDSETASLAALIAAMALGRPLRTPEEAQSLPNPLGGILRDPCARRSCAELATALDAVPYPVRGR